MRWFAVLTAALWLGCSFPALAAETAPVSDVAGATLLIGNQALPLVNFDLGQGLSMAEYRNGGLKQNHVDKIPSIRKSGYASVVVSPDTLAALNAVAGGPQGAQTWEIQLAGVQWTLTGVRMGAIDTPKGGAPSTVHVTYQQMATGDAPAVTPDTTPTQPAAFSDVLTYSGGSAGFSSARSSGNGPVTITLLRGVTSTTALSDHARQQDSFDADLTLNGITQHVHNARVSKYTTGTLNAQGGGDIAIEQLVLVADSLMTARAPAIISRADASVFTTATDPMDSEGCKDSTLPRLKGYNLNDCDPAQPDTYVFAADTGADQSVSGTKLRLAYAIDENVPVPEAQAVLDDYAGLLEARGWTITHQDNLTVTAHAQDGRQWAEVAVNGGGNYQIVYVTP